MSVDWTDLGIDPSRATLTRVDAEGARTPLARAALDRPFEFAPDSCWGIEIVP